MVGEPAPPLNTPEHALDDVITTLASRFPHVDQDAVAQLVRDIYQEISASATIEAHLIPLTQRRATEQLRATPNRPHRTATVHGE